MNELVLAALIGAAAAGLGTWKVMDWRCDAKEKERVEQQLATERAEHAQQLDDARRAYLDNQRRMAAESAALAAGRLREKKLASDAVAATDELGRLRASSDAALRRAAESAAACRDYAATARVVLDECAAAATALAQDAGRWQSESTTVRQFCEAQRGAELNSHQSVTSH